MDQPAEDNFVTGNPEIAPGSSSEGITEVMVSNENVVDVLDIPKSEDNFVTENPDIVPGSSSEGITEVMVSNENMVDVLDIQRAEYNVVAENPVTANRSSSERITEVMDSNNNVVDIKPDLQSKYKKNKMGNVKSKTQNNTTNEMEFAPVCERKSLKRKVAHPPTSEMVMDSIKALKKRNGASFEDISNYIEEKYGVNMKMRKYHVDKFLQKGAGNGRLEKIDKRGTEGRFKIKKSESIKKEFKKLPRKAVKPEKKVAATKSK